MYLGSDEFNNAIENTQGNAPKIRATLANGEILSNIKFMKYYGGSNNSDDISIGTTNMARIDVTVLTDKMLTNNEIFLEQGVELANGVVEYMPIGYFVAQKPQGDIDEVKFTAYDRMQKFEKPYSSSLTYPTNSALILDELCQICGIELATTLENAIEVTENLKGYTCREVLGYIASMHSSFACIDRYGRLNVRWYNDTTIEKSLKKIWHFEKSQDNFEIAKIEIAKDSETNYVSGDGITTLYNSNPLATQEIANNVFAKLGGFLYSVGEIEMLDDARLDPWDMVSVEYYDGKTYNIPCMTLEHDFKAYSTTIKSVGKSESENEYRFTGPTIQYLNRMAADLLVANRVIATKVDAEYVSSHAITTDNLDAIKADIQTLVVDEIDGKYATIDFANIDVANINKTNIGLLFAKVGLIDRATIVDGHITGFLDAVEINANKITAGTLIADRLLLRGSEQSILYQLNSLSRNLLPYPYHNALPRTNRGITFEDYDGKGGIIANGTGDKTGQPHYMCDLYKVMLKANQPYTFASNCTDDRGFITIWFRTADGTGITMSYTETRNGVTSTGSGNSISGLKGGVISDGITFIPSQDMYMQFDLRFNTNVGTVTDAIFYPMLCEGTEAIPYEPYRERTQALTSETVNGEVLTDRTITADKIIAKSITTNELDVNQIFGNEAVLNKLVAQDAFINAIETNRIIVGASENASKALEEVNETVKSITMHYLATTLGSGVTTSTSGWTTTVQQIDATKKYLWTYQTITYADNTTTDTSPVISGVYGNEGKDGQNGQDGTNGVGITSVIPLYYLKSNTTAPSAPTSAVTSTSTGSGVWTKSVPTYVANYTYFTCTQTKYTDNTYSWSTVVADNAFTNANSVANTANSTANTTKTTLDGLTKVDSNVTYIDGGKIYTGSIMAKSIDIDDLFADSAFINALSTNSIIVGATNKANEALNAVDNLSVGGTNLLIRTRTVGTYLNTSGGELKNPDATYSPTMTGDITSDWIDVSLYDNVTITLYDTFTNTTNSGRYCLYDSNKSVLSTTTYNPRTPQSIVVDTSSASYMRITAISCLTYRYKVEKGNKATDWSPAPEDVENNITYVENIANTTQDTLDGLTKLDGDVTVIDGGKIYTRSILANSLAIGDFTNLAVANPDDYNPNGYATIEDDNGFKWFEFGSDDKLGYYSIVLNEFPIATTFNKGDQYLLRCLVYASQPTSIRICLRGHYEASGHINMASVYYDNVTTEQQFIEIPFKVNSLPNAKITHYSLFFETRNTKLGILYVREISVHQMTNGVLIANGSITANKIDVNDLFAQDITATGSITGATLVSLENNSSKVVIDKGEVAIYDFDTRGEGGFYKVGSVFASGGGMVSASGAWFFESLSTELGNDVDEMAARLNKITQRNFVLIGDSYLAGQTPDGDIDSWGVYLKNLLPEYSFSIHAIKGSGFGSTVSGKNFLDALKQYSGDKNSITDIIVCGGYNDAATSITTSAVLTGIANFISYVNQNFPNAKIHIGYVGASNNGMVLEQIKEAIRIYRACGSKGCGYISNMEYTIRNTQFFTSDGVHPNQIGQKNIAWNIASYLTTGNVSVIQEKENCNVVSPSTVTAGITLYTALNNDISSLYHPKTEQLTFTGLSATKMNGAEGSRITLGTLTNSSIIGNQTTSSVATSTANASVSMPINVKTSSGWHTGIGTLEIISLNVLLRVNVLNGNNYLNEAVTDIIIPPFTTTFDSLDV